MYIDSLRKKIEKKISINVSNYLFVILIIMILTGSVMYFGVCINNQKIEKTIKNLKSITQENKEKYNISDENLNLLKKIEKRIIHNPTYEEALDFIKKDQTDEENYDYLNHNCYHFSKKLNNNAEEKGLRCGLVKITMNGPTPHAINVFDTTNKGLLFIEPQTDEIVNLSIGKNYWTECLSYDKDYGTEWIIKDINIFW